MVQLGQRRSDRDALARADLAGGDAEGAFADASGDAGDGLRVGGVPVQNRGGQVLAERHPCEPLVRRQFVCRGSLSLSKQAIVSSRSAAACPALGWKRTANRRLCGHSDDQVACALVTDHAKTGLVDVLAHVVNCDHDGEEPDLSGGRRVEYVVTGIRGALVDAHAVDGPARTYVSPAAVLAQNLKTEVGSLLGCHFSCRVVPGNPGTFFVDFQMTPEPDDQALA
ncbi:hypothetical protein ACWC4D_07985 [Streptomyces sp. NPDC001288]|uniref:hypothetical protein n=1 Tax=Streptomyces sp. NPDC001297 TaxID=3364559 RepID=UPI0036BCD1AE